MIINESLLRIITSHILFVLKWFPPSPPQCDDRFSSICFFSRVFEKKSNLHPSFFLLFIALCLRFLDKAKCRGKWSNVRTMSQFLQLVARILERGSLNHRQSGSLRRTQVPHSLDFRRLCTNCRHLIIRRTNPRDLRSNRFVLLL